MRGDQRQPQARDCLESPGEKRRYYCLPSMIKQIQQDQRNLTKSLMAPCNQPLSLDNLIMMKSHFLPVCQHANFNPISQLLTLNVLIVNKRRHDYNYKSNVWPFPVSAHDHWSEDSEGKDPHLPPGHAAPGRPLHLQRGQRVRQTGNSQGTEYQEKVGEGIVSTT